ncbi:MAG: DUF72 domain-containing protein [Acidobacteriota bacterium]
MNGSGPPRAAPSSPHTPPAGGHETIRVGTAGWSYPDWEGVVYPVPSPPRFDRLRWLASFLDVVEINSTFYRPARRKDALTWVERVAANPRFRFCAKLGRVFTHEPERENRGSEKAFKDGIEPLADAGLLAAVLVQFPYSFKNTASNRRRLADVLTRFGEYSLAVELRHGSWMAAGIMAFLAARGVALVGIDQPQVGQPVPPSLPLTGPFAYARLHGRNAANWFRRGAGRDARYDYLYSAEELAPWIRGLQRAAGEKTQGIVIANNHFRGKAAVNAVEIRHSLSGRMVPAPAPLLAAYPRLASLAVPLPPPQGAPPRLF